MRILSLQVKWGCLKWDRLSKIALKEDQSAKNKLTVEGPRKVVASGARPIKE